jgi:hypothetical protein
MFGHRKNILLGLFVLPAPHGPEAYGSFFKDSGGAGSLGVGEKQPSSVAPPLPISWLGIARVQCGYAFLTVTPAGSFTASTPARSIASAAPP